MSDNAEVIIVFKDDVPVEQVEERAKEIIAGGQLIDLRRAQEFMTTGGTINERFAPILNGFSATLKADQFQTFRGNDSIKYIEGDQRVSIQPI
ncbi:hypothetical protein FRC00_010050 [Tulasnella sp. 408]|nr:hypothetical protein FRC00_010050 [Tulasnella sp. 408]